MLWDDSRYIKTGIQTSNQEGKYILQIKNEYFVNKEFDCNKSKFTFSNGMVYDQLKGYLCQAKESESEDLALTCEPESIGLISDTIPDKYPINSNSWLMFYGRSESENNQASDWGIVLIPEYNMPKVSHISRNDVGNYKSEYFYYHDNNYLIYHSARYGTSAYSIEVYKKNGDLYQTLEIKIPNCWDHSYAKIIM